MSGDRASVGRSCNDDLRADPSANAAWEAALAFLNPVESAAQFLARNHAPPFDTGIAFIDRRAPLRPGAVLEVGGLAGSGKTELLLNVAAACILPAAAGGVAYGGQGTHILFFDLDGKFDALRFIQILQGRIEHALHQAAAGPAPPPSCLPGASAQALEALVAESMGRLSLVRCPTSFHFLAALKVARPAAARMAGEGGVGAVLVDNLTAHYYRDKGARGGGGGGGEREGAPLTLYRVHAAAAAGLKQLQLLTRAPVIATKHILTAGGKDGGDAWSPREVMSTPWQDLVTHRLVLRRGGGGGAAAAPGAPPPPASLGHQAKWAKPELPQVDKFIITRDGIGPA